MNIYIIFHTHRHGHDTQVRRCKQDLIQAWQETSNPVAFADKNFGLDFEPHLGEEIEIDVINVDSIPTVEL